MMSELKPCPFHGVDPVVPDCGPEVTKDYHGHWAVKCDYCGCLLGGFYTPEKAVEAWNHRTEEGE